MTLLTLFALNKLNEQYLSKMGFQIRPKQPISVRHNQNDPMGRVVFTNVAKKSALRTVGWGVLRLGFLVKMHEGALEAKTGCLKSK